MSILARIVQGTVYSVTIDEVGYDRIGLTVTTDDYAGTLRVMEGETEILPATHYSNIAADEEEEPFENYPDLVEWVDSYMSYSIVALEADNVYNVKIQGATLLRHTLVIVLDAEDETIAITKDDVVLVPATLFSNIYVDGSETALAAYGDLVTWSNDNIRYNIIAVAAVDAASVSIDGEEYLRADLEATIDSLGETLTVTEGVTMLIEDATYDDLYRDGLPQTFANFEAMEEWVIANMAPNVHVVAGTDFLVTIDGVEYNRADLIITLDEGAGTLLVTHGFDTIIDEAPYATIYQGDSPTTFASYEELETWVNANIIYNAVVVLAVSATQVSIGGVIHSRSELEVTLDEENGTILVVEGVSTVIPEKLFSLVYLSGSATPFASYAAMAAWVKLYLQYNVLIELQSIYQVRINGVSKNRADLIVTGDEENGQLTVEEGITPLIEDWPYDRIYIVGAATPLFASYAEMIAWVNANVVYNVVTVSAGLANQVNIDGTDYARIPLIAAFDEESGNLKVWDDEDTLINTVYSNIVPDGGVEGFSSFAVMRAWVNAYLLFFGQRIDKADAAGHYLVNGKPLPKNTMFFSWNDTEETFEIRYSHYDLQDIPMPATRYDNIIADSATAGFATYQALIDYIIANTFKA